VIRLHKKQIILIVAIVGLLIFAGTSFAWTQSDNNGKIKQPNQQLRKSTLGTKQFDGTYITFEYSAQYTVRQLEQQSDDLELHQMDANKPYLKKVAVSVSNLPDGTLNSNSAYLLRISHDDKFRERVLDPASLNTEVWSSVDGTKQTVFITQNGRVAVLAFTQDGGDKTLYNSEVDSIVKSFRWK